MTTKEKAKDTRLRREFDITLEEHNKVKLYQKNVCAICKRSKSKNGKLLVLCVDHEHFSGEIRGLLCWQCNKAIAIFQDDPLRMQAAYEYFMNLPFEKVFGKKRFCIPGKIGSKKRNKLIAKARQESNGTKTKRKVV